MMLEPNDDNRKRVLIAVIMVAVGLLLGAFVAGVVSGSVLWPW